MGVTEEAIAALGQNEPANFRLEAEQHIGRLPPAAAPLARLLKGAELQEAFRHHKVLDQEAAVAQGRYKRITSLTLWFIGLAILASIVVVLVPFDQPQETYARLAATALVYLALLVAFGVMIWLSHAEQFIRWSLKRAEAELERGAIFDRVMAATETAGPGELPLLPLQLEYVRRYHLDLQGDYYRQRGEQHRRKARRAKFVQWAATIIVGVWILFAILAAISPVSEQGPVPGVLQRPLAALLAIEYYQLDIIALTVGLIVAMVTAILFARSTIDNNLRDAARYRLAVGRLARLKGRLPEIRAAAAEGVLPVVQGFVRDLQDVLAAEHREWLEMQTFEPKAPARS